MPATASARVTRQASIGRFRAARHARRDADLAERQKMILSVAERVMHIVEETQASLGDTARDRQDWGDKLRETLLSEHIELSEKGLAALTQLRDTRSETAASDYGKRHGYVTDLLTTGRKKRGDDFARDQANRLDFVQRNRDEVVRIVSEDFM